MLAPVAWAAGLLIFVGVVACRWKFQQSKPTVNLEVWLQQQRAIIDFSFAGHSSSTKEGKLLYRAQANHRLVSAFGIDNSLTTYSTDVHEKFVKLSSKLINNSSRRWPELYLVAEGFLERNVENAAAERGQIRLADCVRCLCLIVVLVDAYNINLEGISPDVFLTITREINRQWLESKCDTDAPKSDLLASSLRGLHLKKKLGAGVDISEDTPEEALGFIMPQYETLWRVVLLTFVTAYHRQARTEDVRRGESVPGCLGNPVKEKEALKLAKEGLRLFPSNKRIYRAACGDEKQLISADVEASHRNSRVWGPNALKFRPERFDNLSKLQGKAYFPFSLSPNRCPAIAGFGNRMVTMLVVALGTTLSPKTGKILFNDELLDGNPEEPLPTGRDDMESWALLLRDASGS
ncbi:hypothetical protein B0H67DRAFT_613434 [Lasiosphaeris hirsuta]|uniref:Cytochrome P450 n=1 Tax=Lasiosphaeris hirsuta TaxID=260670 RepID=A0AA39ZWN7_9PEZI|nr:hypothetical protein B0H67DRAFT_613434 [Lasiosphaeris hirsuta]